MFRYRLHILRVLATLLVGVIVFRLADLQLAKGTHFRQIERPERVRYIPTIRGRILSHEGVVLAQHRYVYDLAVEYPYLCRPLPDKWLRREALKRVSRADRVDLAKVREAEGAVRTDVERLWVDVTELTGVPPDELRDRAAAIQRRVERIKEHVNRRRRETGRREVRQVEEELSSHVLVQLDDYLSVIEAVRADPRRYPGLTDMRQAWRIYPQGDLACHIIGYPGGIPRGDNPRERRRREHWLAKYRNEEEALRRYFLSDQPGMTGVELTCEGILRGWRGRVREMLAADGTVHRTLEHVDPRPGRDVRLTIRAPLQKFTQSLLQRVKHKHIVGPLRGAIVVMDIQTGAIWAAASNPTYVPNCKVERDPRERARLNPANFVYTTPGYLEAVGRLRQRVQPPEGPELSYAALLKKARALRAPDTDLKADIATMETIVARIRERHREAPELNRVIAMQIPSGSIFKLITAVAALHTPACHVTPRSTIYCAGHMGKPQGPFRCHIYIRVGWGHGDTTFEEGIVKSCNCFFYTCGQRLGLAKLALWADRFGFGKTTGIDLPGEKAGFLPSPKSLRARYRRGVWPGDVMNLAIGQGALQVTPLQVVRAVAAIANGGTLPTPHVVGRVTPPAGQAIPGVKKHLLAALRKCMWRVVESKNGTAHRHVYMADFPVAGKTGTAEPGGPGKAHAWFTGYAPADKPRFAFVFALENAGHGGDACGPLAKETLLFMRQQGYFAPEYPPIVQDKSPKQKPGGKK